MTKGEEEQTTQWSKVKGVNKRRTYNTIVKR
jgi:hypothetical protein